ncbi:MAG: 4Fe-4S dicluster domain-containing protein [Candidatus Brocadiaceae bacterium]|nr:4Fe-4S dicluster domain-containing protein [Candidatus Brocadiaceae bacterium]
MTDRRFEVIILERYCKGCGLCVAFCEHGKLVIDPRPNKRGVQAAVVQPDVECTGCLRCTAVCPDAAVEVFRIGRRTGKADASATK